MKGKTKPYIDLTAIVNVVNSVADKVQIGSYYCKLTPDMLTFNATLELNIEDPERYRIAVVMYDENERPIRVLKHSCEEVLLSYRDVVVMNDWAASSDPALDTVTRIDVIPIIYKGSSD